MDTESPRNRSSPTVTTPVDGTPMSEDGNGSAEKKKKKKKKKKRTQKHFALPGAASLHGGVRWWLNYDVETTGPKKNHDQIIQLSGVLTKVDTKDATAPVEFDSKVRVSVDVHWACLAVHGLSKEIVEKEPTFDVVGKRFIDWIKDHVGDDDVVVLVAHNGKVTPVQWTVLCRAAHLNLLRTRALTHAHACTHARTHARMPKFNFCGS